MNSKSVPCDSYAPKPRAQESKEHGNHIADIFDAPLQVFSFARCSARLLATASSKSFLSRRTR
jgi:hypothetical protein